MALVTLTMAKAHLRVTDDRRNADIAVKLAQAEAVILDYLQRPTDAVWTATIADWAIEGSPPNPAPLAVQAAVLLVVAELDADRGDETPTAREAPGDLSPRVKSLLYRWRLPVLA